VIVLYTDFGAADIYVGQMKAALLAIAPAVPIVDLLHDAPAFHVGAAAHLLCALQRRFAPGTIFVAVVDPGVGTARDAVALSADGKWYVGPDNGLLSIVAARATAVQASRIIWRPPSLSESFHGRDLFAPLAARIATGTLPPGALQLADGLGIQLGAEDAPEVIYVDHYGNALTGLRAAHVPHTATLGVRGRRLARARVFGDAPSGGLFWYENSLGLVEVAANRASAAALLDLAIGEPVEVLG
jgi:S-adenosylmethionine hydrolase